MSKFKLCNNGLSVVGRIEDGVTVSCLIEAEEYKQWLSEGNTPEPEFTEEELRVTSVNKQIQEAKTYLASTDFYMTVDKYAELDEARKVELTTKRAEAREVINTLEAKLAIIDVN